MEQDAAPAGVSRSRLTLPGGAGAPPAGTMTRREELADGRANAPAGGSLCAAAQKGPRRIESTADVGGRRKRGPAPQNRRDGCAERRHASRNRMRATKGTA